MNRYRLQTLTSRALTVMSRAPQPLARGHRGWPMRGKRAFSVLWAVGGGERRRVLFSGPRGHLWPWCGTSPLGRVVSETTAVLPWGGLSCISSVNPSTACYLSAEF